MSLRRCAALLLFCPLAAGCGSEPPPSSKSTTSRSSTDSGKKTPAADSPADVYNTLRTQALEVKPGAVGQAGAGESTVIAVLVETGYPRAVATLVAVADGSARLSFSTGGGLIGAGEHAPVRKVASELIAMAQRFLPNCTPTDAYPLPDKGRVRGYLVTPGGVHTFDAPEEALGRQRHPCAPLFFKAHELIATIREHAKPPRETKPRD